MEKIKIFCLPYAGGSATVYHNWFNDLNRRIELYPVELRGRGKRYRLPLYCSINEMVEDVFNAIKYDLIDQEYALFGHSMGSLIIFELYYKILHAELKPPIHLFFSGMDAPHILKLNKKILHVLPDDEFIEEIAKLGGTPQEVIDNKELMKVFLPTLRADYRAVEMHEYTQMENKMNSKITVFVGENDHYSKGDPFAWSIHTDRSCAVHQFHGGHFFIHNHIEEITSIINNTLVLHERT